VDVYIEIWIDDTRGFFSERRSRSCSLNEIGQWGRDLKKVQCRLRPTFLFVFDQCHASQCTSSKLQEYSSKGFGRNMKTVIIFVSLGWEVTVEFGNYTKATTAYCAKYENGQETRREGDGGSYVKDTKAHFYVLFEELTLKIIMLAFRALCTDVQPLLGIQPLTSLETPKLKKGVAVIIFIDGCTPSAGGRVGGDADGSQTRWTGNK